MSAHWRPVGVLAVRRSARPDSILREMNAIAVNTHTAVQEAAMPAATATENLDDTATGVGDVMGVAGVAATSDSKATRFAVSS